MLTMLLGGLWHGASWTFVAWGGIHGAILIMYRLLGIDAHLERVKPDSLSGTMSHVAAWLALMPVVMLTWIFFRARSFDDAWTVLTGCFGTAGLNFDAFRAFLFYVAPLIAVEIYQRFSGNVEFMTRGPFLVRYSAAMSVVLATVALSAGGGHQFIYFDF
jgi:D-alanyl-lipoteichoic acid acyltransferase DltB (MBOAT superfamily)